jgi:hypothetical protein
MKEENKMFLFTSEEQNFAGMIRKDMLSKIVKETMTSEYRFTQTMNYVVSMNRSEVISFIDQIGKIYFINDSEYFCITNDVFIYGYIIQGRNYEETIIKANILSKTPNITNPFNFKDIRMKNEVVTVYWYYSYGAENKLRYETIQENFDDVIHREAYPYIDVEELVDAYVTTPEPVLILIGKPGTGKTRLCRYIVRKIAERERKAMKYNVTYDDEFDDDTRYPKVSYTTDSRILTYDQVFIELLSGEISALILEDMDKNFTSKTESNEMMVKMLATSDGFLCNRNSKIIISSNIKGNDIDEALLRPGRCFALIETRELDRKEAENLARKIDVVLPEHKTNFTLADIYSIRNKTKKYSFVKKTGIGFLNNV